MENKNQTRGLYRLVYGYSDHILLFVETAENVQKMIDAEYTYCMETSKHSSEDVEVKYATLITTDQKFIDQFVELKLCSDNPYDCYLEEISEKNEFIEVQGFYKPSITINDAPTFYLLLD